MLKYRDEKDKSYGIVGMAIAMRVWNADDMYGSVNIDADGFECVRFAGEYYYTSAADGISPRSAFHHSVKIFKMMMGMALSNAMCRSMVLEGKQLDAKDSKELLDVFSAEGETQYAITPDECNAIFKKSYNYLNRLYNYQQVHSLVKSLSDALIEKRELSQHEIAEFLSIIE